ncbi:hypothetical protein GZ205_03940, partial [Dermatophilus congolensis]|nr:hypothetical protein [Dermatophilus congolensis]
RCHAPFTTTDLATRLGLGEHIIRTHLHHLENTGNIITGELHPANTGQDHCDPEILRLLRRRSLAALRAQVEPVTPTTYAQYLTTWHGITTETGTPQPQEHGTEGLLHVIEQLAGYRLPASALETLILPTRITNYTPTLLDDLLTRGEITWQGNGSTAGDDGWISLHLTDDAPNTLHTPTTTPPPESIHATILTILATGGGFFFPTLANTVREHITTTTPRTLVPPTTNRNRPHNPHPHHRRHPPRTPRHPHPRSRHQRKHRRRIHPHLPHPHPRRRNRKYPPRLLHRRTRRLPI